MISKKIEVTSSTFRKYFGVYENYILSSPIGSIKLQDLTPQHLQNYYHNLQHYNNKSSNIIHSIHSCIKSSLLAAQKIGYIKNNITDCVYLPKLVKSESIPILTIEEQKLFIEAIKGHPLEILFLIGMSTGLRVGEILALTWDNLDSNNKTLFIEKSLNYETDINEDHSQNTYLVEGKTKNKTSCRIVPLSDKSFSILQSYKLEQDKHIIKVKDIYFNNNYIFCNFIGCPISKNKPNKELKAILISLNIQPIRFHDLRHNFSTRLFEVDTPQKVVQTILGHASIDATMNIYTHVTKSKLIQSRDKLNEVF